MSGSASPSVIVPTTAGANLIVSEPAWALAAFSAARRVVALNVPVPVGVTLPAASPSVVTVYVLNSSRPSERLGGAGGRGA